MSSHVFVQVHERLKWLGSNLGVGVGVPFVRLDNDDRLHCETDFVGYIAACRQQIVLHNQIGAPS